MILRSKNPCWSLDKKIEMLYAINEQTVINMIAKRQNTRAVHRVEVLGDLHLVVHDEKTRFNGDAMDLSVNGIHFLSLLRVPLYREVDVHLQLPRGDGKETARVHCHGVVVRCAKRVQPFFEISVFFLDMPSGDKQKIQRYMDHVCPPKTLHQPLGPR